MFRKGIFLMSLLVAMLLAGCKPSDTYAGEWYALSNKGEEVIINFSEDKTMTVTNANGEEETFELNQTGAGFQNNIGYYKVEIDNKSHYVILEDRKDESNAILVKQTNVASDFEDLVGEIIYSMNRDSYPETIR